MVVDSMVLLPTRTFVQSATKIISKKTTPNQRVVRV